MILGRQEDVTVRVWEGVGVVGNDDGRIWRWHYKILGEQYDGRACALRAR